MKAAIRYYTQTGNTKKLADAIADELGIKAETVETPLSEPTDIVFICNSVYFAGVDKHIKKFIKDNSENIGTMVNVSSAALIESTYGRMKAFAAKEGVKLSDMEFHCRGKFASLHSGHPDEQDIKAVREFAKKVAQ